MGKITIGYASVPPYTYTDESGRATGELNELTRQVLTAAGVRHAFVELPVGRVALYIKSGEIDLFHGLQFIPPLDGLVLAGDTRLTMIQLVAYSLADAVPIDRYQGLAGKSVVTLLGLSYGKIGQFINEPASRVDELAVQDRDSAFGMLARGRVDYLLDYRAPATHELGAAHLAGLHQALLFEKSLHWLASKASPQAERLIKTLDDTYQTLGSEGQLRP